MTPGGSTIKYNTTIRVILAGPKTQRLLKLVGLRLKPKVQFWDISTTKLRSIAGVHPLRS